MDKTILYPGLACIITAIVGGGVKAFGTEMPLVNSLKRQLLLGAFGCLLVAFSYTIPNAGEKPALPAQPLPHLAVGTWTLRNAIGSDGRDWSGSTLKFLSQKQTQDGLALKGAFSWRLAGRSIGSEEFSGQYLSTGRQIILEGVKVATNADTPSGDRLAVGSYSAVVADDERSLVSGQWGSTMTNPEANPGKWEATR